MATTTKPTTVAEYDALLLEKNNAVDKLKDEIRVLRRERDKVAAEATIDEKLAKMSPEEREALAQRIGGAGAIKSAEAVKGLKG